MATYTIQINERTSLGRTLPALLQAVPQVISFQMTALYLSYINFSEKFL
ncbi:MAG: hypothetical protein LBS50_04045 [Prevotellaceae bacterium]|nr:hypothetical protein [Prevotellaceae bacterium]